jgi:glutamate 5-kinase
LELGCIPIINENDAIANNEIRYGDNDHLAALLAHLVSADMLVLLTDTAGLYTSDPRTNSDATVISVVAADDPLLSVSASGAGSDRGSGGMASKLAAARIASWSGVTAVIAAAESDSAVMAAINGETVGTRFLPHDRQLSARKLWIAFAAEVEGSIAIDAGARDALVLRGTSLLPAGVTAVTGSFDVGAVVEVVTETGELLARGLTAMSSDVVAASMGKRTADLVDLAVVETVHRDDLVVLANQ